MKDQIKRIREKDYSKIDETLFANLARTDNLQSTLSHLSEFQQFLMEQIANINQSHKNGDALSLTSNISKNFQTLRESLVKCSKVVNQNDKATTSILKKKLTVLENDFSKTKKGIQRQIDHACQETKKYAENAIQQVLLVLEKERASKRELEGKCAALIKENQIIQRENESLKKEKGNDTFRTLYTPDLMSESSVHHQSTFPMNQNEKSQLAETGPLKERRFYSNGVISVPSFSDKDWKIEREIKDQGQGFEQRRGSLSRQPSNHKLSSKDNLYTLKENEALLRKGVREQRRKSKQKIKLFSMI